MATRWKSIDPGLVCVACPGFHLARVDASAANAICSAHASRASLEWWLSCTGWFSGSLGLDQVTDPISSANGLAEMFLCAVGPRGDLQWLVTASTHGLHPYSMGYIVTTCSDGSCVVAGNVKGRARFSTAHEREIDTQDRELGFLARYAEDGRLDWVQVLPGASTRIGDLRSQPQSSTAPSCPAAQPEAAAASSRDTHKTAGCAGHGNHPAGARLRSPRL